MEKSLTANVKREEDAIFCLAKSISESETGYKKTFTSCNTLKMSDLPGKVAVVRSFDNSVTVLIDADKEFIEEMSLSVDAYGCLIVKGPQKENVMNTFSGSDVSFNISDSDILGSFNISGSNILNGVRLGGNRKKKWEKEPKIIIIIPKGIKIVSRKVSDSFIVGIKGDVSIQGSGESKTKLIQVENLEVNCSGKSDIEAREIVGNVTMHFSGQKQIIIDGNMKDVEIDMSGMSNIDIFGVIKNDLSISASGMSQINCHAQVFGNIEKNTSGMCSINIL